MIFAQEDGSKPNVVGDEGARRLEVAKRFGRAVKRLRETSGKSAVSVAEALGYTRAGLSNIENGKTSGPPDLERALRFLEVFGIDSELFWALLEASAVTPRPGVDPEIERRLALAQALGEQILGLVREGRKLHQDSLEQNESQQEG